MQNVRPRVCAAIISDNRILMVLHRDAQRDYWTLPGGGVEAGESPMEAVVREVKEETGLNARVIRLLFEREYLEGTSISQCYLMAVENEHDISLGFDPEEQHLDANQRLLQGIKWHTLESMKDDFQVSDVLRNIGR